MSTRTTHQHHKHQTHTPGTEERGAENPPPEDTDRFRLTQIRAYSLWEQAGKPNDDGSRERFWCEAERTITASLPPVV